MAVIKQTSHILLIHPVADFCTLGFVPTPRRLLAYRPDPLGPVIESNSQILLTHSVADFCTLGFAPTPIGPRWPHPRGRPRWFSAYRSDPWWLVIKPTCQIILIHSVADFCTLGFAPSPMGPG